MNDPYKEQLTDFIYRRLPDLLRENNGKVRKKEARRILRDEYSDTQNGWPASLEEQDGNGPRWTNAWGHALRRLAVEGITETCSKKVGSQPAYYRLRGVG